MNIYCRGTARIRQRDTAVVYHIETDELEWEAVGSDERNMGTETHYEAVLDHPQLGRLKWGLWEYPTGVENHSNVDAGGHEVIEDFDFGLQHEKPDPDEWLDYEVPGNPLEIFMNSYHQTGDLLANNGGDDGRDLVNRLVFSQQITALETYLADTLLNEVAGDASAMGRLIDRDSDLSKQKFPLAEIRKDPGLVERKVREYLREILYHNLAKVDVLYQIALEISILNLTANKKELFRAVKLRHDCVHRSGFDRDGNELTVFTRSFVNATADLIRGFVERVESAVSARHKPGNRGHGQMSRIKPATRRI